MTALEELKSKLSLFDMSSLPREVPFDLTSGTFLHHLKKKLPRYVKNKTRENFIGLGQLIEKVERELQLLKPKISLEEQRRLSEVRELQSLAAIKKPSLPLLATSEEINRARREYSSDLFDVDLSWPTSVKELRDSFTRLLEAHGEDIKVRARVTRGCDTCGDDSITLRADLREDATDTEFRINKARREEYEAQLKQWNRREELIKKHPDIASMLKIS